MSNNQNNKMVKSMIPRIKKRKDVSNLNSNIFICATLDKLFTPSEL